MLSITILLLEKATIPFSSRPSRTVLTKSSLLSVLRLSISDGPTRPSWLAPWQRSHAPARQARNPFIVLESTLYPSTTVYSLEFDAAGGLSCAPAATAAVKDAPSTRTTISGVWKFRIVVGQRSARRANPDCS